jgi:hypothetical protein
MKNICSNWAGRLAIKTNRIKHKNVELRKTYGYVTLLGAPLFFLAGGAQWQNLAQRPPK